MVLRILDGRERKRAALPKGRAVQDQRSEAKYKTLAFEREDEIPTNTTVFMFNQTRPSALKVCQIAA